jgi:hypothetical protein
MLWCKICSFPNKRKTPQAKAEAYFEHALAVARELQAKSWGTSMTWRWRDQGERQQAHDLLAPIFDWFTAGFDTPDEGSRDFAR